MLRVTDPAELTAMLERVQAGEAGAWDQLIERVHHELGRIARVELGKESRRDLLQTTALVNETYLRLCGNRDVPWRDRAHFFSLAAQVMRHLLVDHARSRKVAKRGGGARQVTLDAAALVSPERAGEVLALDEALAKLADLDPRKSRLVELRYFGGLSEEETAEVIGVSRVTIQREWLKAKAWLYLELTGEASDNA